MIAVQGGALFSEEGRSLPSATVSRQSLTSGNREPQGLIHQEVVQDSSSVASDHSPIRYAAVSKAPCVLCYSVAFLQPWGYPRTYAFPPITIITSVLRLLRASHTCDLTLIAPLLPSRGWSPALLDLPPDTPMELP